MAAERTCSIGIAARVALGVRLEREAARLKPIFPRRSDHIDPHVLRAAQFLESGAQQLTHVPGLAGREPEQTQRLDPHGALNHTEIAIVPEGFEKLQQAGNVAADFRRCRYVLLTALRWRRCCCRLRNCSALRHRFGYSRL